MCGCQHHSEDCGCGGGGDGGHHQRGGCSCSCHGGRGCCGDDSCCCGGHERHHQRGGHSGSRHGGHGGCSCGGGESPHGFQRRFGTREERGAELEGYTKEMGAGNRK